METWTTLSSNAGSGVVAASAAFLFITSYIVHALFFAPFSHVPGPRICKLTRLSIAFHDIRLQRNEKIYQWHKKYGPVILIAPGEVSFATPGPTREIYGSTGRHPKSTYFDNFEMYGERMIFCALGWAEHREMRKRTFAFYSPTSVTQAAVIDPVRARCKLFLDLVGKDIAAGQATIDVLSRCNLYAFDNITGLIYGTEHASHSMESEASTERTIVDGWKLCEVWNNLLYNLPFVHGLLRILLSYNHPGFLAAEEKLRDWNWERLVEVMSDRKSDQDLSLVRHLQKVQRAPSGQPLSNPEIGAEVLDNIHAAQTTVGLALTYTLWNLASNQDWQERVRQELHGLPVVEDGLPSFAHIDKAPILNACIRESYRINPLSSGRAERVVPITKRYEGVVLPSRTIVSSSTLALHRSEAVFPDPLRYNPARWLEADPASLRGMESCFIPFGYGARICLGKVFANAEVKLLIAAILLQYKICPDEQSSTNVSSMTQMGTQNALPRGLQCELRFEYLDKTCSRSLVGSEAAAVRKGWTSDQLDLQHRTYECIPLSRFLWQTLEKALLAVGEQWKS